MSEVKPLVPKEVFRIIDKASGDVCGSYSRAYHTEYDFNSVEAARSANCHGMFEDKEKYKIAKYRVTYELIDGDCDGAEGYVPPPKTEEQIEAERIASDIVNRIKEGWNK